MREQKVHVESVVGCNTHNFEGLRTMSRWQSLMGRLSFALFYSEPLQDCAHVGWMTELIAGSIKSIEGSK